MNDENQTPEPVDENVFAQMIEDAIGQASAAQDMATAYEEAMAERERLRAEVEERADGRTPDEIAREALFEALVSQRAIEALTEAISEIYTTVKDRYGYLHKHIHVHDKRNARLTVSFVAELAARLTGEKDLNIDEIDEFMVKTATEIEEQEVSDDDSGVYTADAFITFLRERRDNRSRFEQA